MGLFSSCLGGDAGKKPSGANPNGSQEPPNHRRHNDDYDAPEMPLVSKPNPVAAASKKTYSSFFPASWALGENDDALFGALGNCDSPGSESVQLVGLSAFKLLASKYASQNTKETIITQALIDHVVRKSRILERLRSEHKNMGLLRRAAASSSAHEARDDDEDEDDDDEIPAQLESDNSFELFLTLLGQGFCLAGFQAVEGISRDFGFNSAYFGEGVLQSSDMAQQLQAQKVGEERKREEEREAERLQREEDMRSRFEGQLQKKTLEIEALRKDLQRVVEEDKQKRISVEKTWQSQLEMEHQTSLDRQEELEATIERLRREGDTLRAEAAVKEAAFNQALRALEGEKEEVVQAARRREEAMGREFQQKEEDRRQQIEEERQRREAERAKEKEEAERRQQKARQEEEEERKRRQLREDEERKSRARLEEEARAKQLREDQERRAKEALASKPAAMSPVAQSPERLPTLPGDSPQKPSPKPAMAATVFASMLQPKPFQSGSPMSAGNGGSVPGSSIPNLDLSFFESSPKQPAPADSKPRPTDPFLSFTSLAPPPKINPPPPSISVLPSPNPIKPKFPVVPESPTASSPVSDFVPDDYSEGYGKALTQTDSETMIGVAATSGRGGTHSNPGSASKKPTGPKYSKIGH